MGAELLHGVEIGHILGQLIVYFGQLLGADGVYLNVEHGVLALELVAVVFIGELNVKILLLANIHAYHLLFKAGYEHAAADGQLLMLCRAAIELNAVHCAAVIKFHFVAVFNGALNVYHAGDLLALALDLCVHHFIRNIILLLCHFYTLILAQSDLGHNGNNSLKLHILALFGAENGYFRPVYGLNIVLFNGGFVNRRIRYIKRIVHKYIPTVGLFDNALGRMSLAEAGYRDGLAQLKIRAVYRLFKIRSGNAHSELHLIALKLFKTCHNILRTINNRCQTGGHTAVSIAYHNPMPFANIVCAKMRLFSLCLQFCSLTFFYSGNIIQVT